MEGIPDEVRLPFVKIVQREKTIVAIESFGNPGKGHLSPLTRCVESECVQNNLIPAAGQPCLNGLTFQKKETGGRRVLVFSPFAKE